jgi:hypothetical protein
MQSFNTKGPNNTLTQHIKDNVTLRCVALSNVAAETKANYSSPHLYTDHITYHKSVSAFAPMLSVSLQNIFNNCPTRCDLISNFRRVLNLNICILLGISPASD